MLVAGIFIGLILGALIVIVAAILHEMKKIKYGTFEVLLFTGMYSVGFSGILTVTLAIVSLSA